MCREYYNEGEVAGIEVTRHSSSGSVRIELFVEREEDFEKHLRERDENGHPRYERIERLRDVVQNHKNNLVGVAAYGGVVLPEDMWGLFQGCKRLQTVDFSGARVHEDVDATEMFKACDNLWTLDLGGWEIGLRSYTDGIIEGCDNLEYFEQPKLGPSRMAQRQLAYGTGDCRDECSLIRSNKHDQSLWAAELTYERPFLVYDGDALVCEYERFADANEHYENLVSAEYAAIRAVEAMKADAVQGKAVTI
jgi:hypothetical protein